MNLRSMCLVFLILVATCSLLEETSEEDECTYTITDNMVPATFPIESDFGLRWFIFPSGLIDYSLSSPKFEGGIYYPTQNKSESTLLSNEFFLKNFREFSLSRPPPENFNSECVRDTEGEEQIDINSKCWEIETIDPKYPKYFQSKSLEGCRYEFHHKEKLPNKFPAQKGRLAHVEQRSRSYFLGYFQPFQGQIYGEYYDMRFQEKINRRYVIHQLGSFDIFLSNVMERNEDGSIKFVIKTREICENLKISGDFFLVNVEIEEKVSATIPHYKMVVKVREHTPTDLSEGALEISFTTTLQDGTTTEVFEDLLFVWMSQGYSFSTPFKTMKMDRRNVLNPPKEDGEGEGEGGPNRPPPEGGQGFNLNASITFTKNNKLVIDLRSLFPIGQTNVIKVEEVTVDSFSVLPESDDFINLKNHFQHEDVRCDNCNKEYSVTDVNSLEIKTSFDTQSYGNYLIHIGMKVTITPEDVNKDVVVLYLDGNENVRYSPYELEQSDQKTVWPYYLSIGVVGTFGICVAPGACLLVPGVILVLKGIWRRNKMKLLGERVSTSSESDGEVYCVGRRKGEKYTSSEGEYRENLMEIDDGNLEQFENEDIKLRIPLATGKFAQGTDGLYYHIVDLSFKFINKQILENRPSSFASKKNIVQVLNGLKASKYIAYSHCKYCFLEQREFIEKWEKKMRSGYESDDDEDDVSKELCNCCKCGLPLIPYVGFRKDERFCIICATLNKYDTKNHGRCLLHVSARRSSKSAGCVYYLYKDMYSVATAARKKKKCESSDRLAYFLENENWILNCAMRFEYLSLCKFILGRELFVPFTQKEDIRALEYTKKLFEERKISLLPQKKFKYEMYNLTIDLDKISKGKATEFKKNYMILLNKTIATLNRHLHVYDSLMKEKVTLKKRSRDDETKGESGKKGNMNLEEGNQKMRKIEDDDDDILNTYSPNSNCSTDTVSTSESEGKINILMNDDYDKFFNGNNFLGMGMGDDFGLNLNEELKETFIDELVPDEETWETIDLGTIGLGITVEKGGLSFDQLNPVFFNNHGSNFLGGSNHYEPQM